MYWAQRRSARFPLPCSTPGSILSASSNFRRPLLTLPSFLYATPRLNAQTSVG